MEINRFFNQLPIRILGTHEEPAFYANEIAKILVIKDTRSSLRNFSPKEIVQPVDRKRLGIKTYRIYKDKNPREDPNMILLTIRGVYRMMMNSRTEIAEKFRDWVFDVLEELRLVGKYEVEQKLEKLKTINEQQLQEIGQLKTYITELEKQQEKLENFSEKIYLIEIPNDIRKITQQNVSEEDLESDCEEIDEAENTIDDWELYCRLFPDPADRTPPFTYKLVKNIDSATMSKYNVRYTAFVKNADDALRQLDRKLMTEKANSKPGTYYYECPLHKITSAIDVYIKEIRK